MEFFFRYIVVCVAFCSVHVLSSPLIGHNVKPARKGEFPFIVSIQYVGEYPLETEGHICGGTLISENHILTASHCICGLQLKNLRIVIGSSDLRSSQARRVIPISRVTYMQWARRKNIYSSSCDDISILEFVDDMNIDPVTFSPLNREELIGRKVTTAGWGSLNDKRRPHNMHRVSLTVMSNDECEKKVNQQLQTKIRILDRYMCADANPWSLSAPGDSGNPVLDANKALVGMHVADCPDSAPCPKSKVDMILRIGYYIDFIVENTMNNEITAV